MLLLLLLACPAIIFADDIYEPCPPLPSPRSVPASLLASDPGVRAALAEVTALWAASAAPLPTGLVGTIVFDQQTLWSGGFGTRNYTRSAPHAAVPPAPTDLVRIASITKVFTDVLLFKMRDAGLVGLDDTLDQHIPGGLQFRKIGRTRGAVTLRNLASHLSGLPRETPYPCSFGGARCSEKDALDSMRGTLLPVLPPNRRFHYSNLGIALLGRALAHAAADPSTASYEALMAKEVLVPLGMVNATFSVAAALAGGGDRIAVGSGTDGSRLNFSETCVPAPGMVGSFNAPCGCLWASADDIAVLMKLFFRDDAPASAVEEGRGNRGDRGDMGDRGEGSDIERDREGDIGSGSDSDRDRDRGGYGREGAANNQILDGDTLAELLRPSVLLRDGSSAVGTPWEMKYSTESQVWVKSKQGELPGYRSSVSVVEELKLGVFTSALVSDVDEHSVWTIPGTCT